MTQAHLPAGVPRLGTPSPWLQRAGPPTAAPSAPGGSESEGAVTHHHGARLFRDSCAQQQALAGVKDKLVVRQETPATEGTD